MNTAEEIKCYPTMSLESIYIFLKTARSCALCNEDNENFYESVIIMTMEMLNAERVSEVK